MNQDSKLLKKIQAFYRNKKQRIRERILAPCCFWLMDLVKFQRHLPYDCTGEAAAELIYQTIMAGKPCMIGRIGATEIRNIEGVLHQHGSLWQKMKWFISFHQTGQSKKLQQCWLTTEDHPDDAFFERFTEMMLEDMKCLDIFASWRWEENGVFQKPYQFQVISLGDLEPFFSKSPWTRALEGKTVLVVQPFAEDITHQYSNRKALFPNTEILPEFTLKTYIPFFKGLARNPTQGNWFDNLEQMKKEISALDFDIALIAAGAYGFPLAAHVKRMNRQAVLMGGVLQLLFGIKGARWDGVPVYHVLYNEHWIYPGEKYRPASFSNFDGGCYWK